MAVAFGALALSFWYLQVVQFRKYRELAETNHQRTLALRAPRGILYDRDEHALVENRESFNISIVREHSRDIESHRRDARRSTGVRETEIRYGLQRGRNQPRYRPIPVIEDATLDQVAAVRARRSSSCPT